MAAELKVGDRLSLGGRLEGSEFLGGTGRELEATAFVKYVLGRSGGLENALKLTLGSTFGQSDSFDVILAYTVRF